MLAALSTCAAPAGAASLPAVTSGHRPGPDALYDPPPDAPQLQNAAPWSAAPILISGASAYRDGEFLYQDYIYDDHGAAGVPDLSDPWPIVDFLYSPKAGTLTYPTAAELANNAADLVELRIKPVAGATALRVTLNSMSDPPRSAFTVAIGSSAEPVAWPHGAGVRSPAQLFLTVHGDSASLVDAATGAARTPAPTASVDLQRRQIDVRIPHAAWNPGTEKVRFAAATGLWGGDGYLRPGPIASATAPGGLSPSGSGLFNVAFRHDEPMPDLTQGGLGLTMADAAAGGRIQAAFWRERHQADVLASGDLSPLFELVDFGKLAARTGDESRVPKTGPMNRIFATSHVYGQGADFSKLCGGLLSAVDASSCTGALVGQLQPYALYVPRKPRPRGGYGLTLLLHSLSANYNQYLDSNNQSQLGERGAGSIVATPSSRGPDGGYHDIAEADSFEMWADIARHYELDPDWTAVSGYSMGGGGTWRYLARWPDLFARGFSTVGPRGAAAGSLASLRNTPVMAWAATADELVNVAETEGTNTQLQSLGLRFVTYLFAVADHLTIATNDEYSPAAGFLGEHRVDRNPAHVTYVVDPSLDSQRAHTIADHAYWLSDLRVRDGKRSGTIDARSQAFGVGDPPVLSLQRSAGVLNGGAHGPMPYASRTQEWGPAPAVAKADRLVVRHANLAAATVDTKRAGLSCAPALDVDGDGPLALSLACPPVPRPRRCATVLRVKVPRLRGARTVTVRVSRGSRVLEARPRPGVRVVRVRRPTRRAFRLRIQVRAGNRRVTVARRYRACR